MIDACVGYFTRGEKMKITFEDNGRQVCIETKHDLKEARKTMHADYPGYNGIDSYVGMLNAVSDEILAVLSNPAPFPDERRTVINRAVYMLEMVDPGAPIDFWYIIRKQNENNI